MRLIVTSSIKRSEFEPYEKLFNLEVLKVASKKCIEGLGENIKSSVKIPGTVLKKVYLTSSSGAGRVIFLLKMQSKTSVLLMLRPKKDKQVGTNMAVKNPKFRKLLEKNLDLILQDLANGNYEEFML